MSTLHNQLAVAEAEEVARGVRLLLRTPLLTQAADGEGFDLVRRRQQPLRAWFDYHCGWTLTVEPRLGYARLLKVGTVHDASRPARRARSGRAPFDRRRYTLLCVVAAELLDTPATTIGLLADRVVQACALDEALPSFDTSRRPERMAFVDALVLLEQLGVLEVLDGSSDAYVEAESAKALYRVNTTLLVRLLASPRSPSTLEVGPGEIPERFEELLAALGRESRYGVRDDAGRDDTENGGTDAVDGPGASHAPFDAADGGSADGHGGGAAWTPAVADVRRTLWLRHSILRRLLDEPVVHLDDLTVQQREYAATLTGRQLIRRAATQGGFVLEERAEGLMFVDPDQIATDSVFPDGGSTAKVAALLLLDALVAAGQPLSVGELTLVATEALTRFPSWAKAYREDDGPHRLAEDATAVLESFRLARREGDLVTARPAAMRYTVSVDAAAAGPTGSLGESAPPPPTTEVLP
ncbi:MAG TPA: TIGR02678 family protein [Kineosporiaceae bacterium]